VQAFYASQSGALYFVSGKKHCSMVLDLEQVFFSTHFEHMGSRSKANHFATGR
jgi:hypothetical protein